MPPRRRLSCPRRRWRRRARTSTKTSCWPWPENGRRPSPVAKRRPCCASSRRSTRRPSWGGRCQSRPPCLRRHKEGCVTDVVRMGVVGAGSIAVRGILPHLSQDDVQDRVRLAAVCDPVPGRAAAAAARFGVEKAFLDYADLLAHGDVDAVTIASPIGLHFEQGRQALTTGKHVHFNKTMTTTLAEASELIELARARNLKIVASPGETLRPHNQQVKKLIAEGAIVGHKLNGTPFDYPGRELAQQAPHGKGDQWLLPHVVGKHRDIEEQHVYEDIMQLIDWIREDKPSIVTAEHARHVVEIIEAAYRAAETDQTQELTTTVGRTQ